jgi:hypothetical protein
VQNGRRVVQTDCLGRGRSETIPAPQPIIVPPHPLNEMVSSATQAILFMVIPSSSEQCRLNLHGRPAPDKRCRNAHIGDGRSPGNRALSSVENHSRRRVIGTDDKKKVLLSECSSAAVLLPKARAIAQ